MLDGISKYCWVLLVLFDNKKDGGGLPLMGVGSRVAGFRCQYGLTLVRQNGGKEVRFCIQKGFLNKKWPIEKRTGRKGDK